MRDKSRRTYFTCKDFLNNNNKNNNNNSNNNNISSETRKYWVDVQQGMVLSHGVKDPL